MPGTPPGTTSELEIFKALSNPTRVNFNKGAVAEAIQTATTPNISPIQTPVETPAPSPVCSPFRPKHSPQQSPQPSQPASRPSEREFEKQALLIELHRLSTAYGIVLSQTFSMESRYEDILFEYNRQLSHTTTSRHVNMGFEVLCGFATCVELANHKFGPVLNVDGWSGSIREQRNQYVNVLTRLYNKRFRPGFKMSPEAELGVLLFGGLVAQHFKHNDLFSAAASTFVPRAPDPPPSPPMYQAARMQPPRSKQYASSDID